MTKSRILVCSLVLLLAPDALPGQPSGALRARPEHLRAASDMAAKVVLRLTPRRPVALEVGALPTDDPIGWLSFQKAFYVDAHSEFYSSATGEGQASLPENGIVRISVVPPQAGEPYVLVVFASSDFQRSYYLRNLKYGDVISSPTTKSECLVNFQLAGDQLFENVGPSGPETEAALAAVGDLFLRILVERPAYVTTCHFSMTSTPYETVEEWQNHWRFHFAELREP